MFNIKDKYTIVISFDAVSSRDIDILKNLPNFKKIIEGGSLIKKVKSIYPTLTYPAHATLVTGMYPKNHGIVDNTKFKAGYLSPNWYWYRKDIKCETIYDIAKSYGLKTCSLLWPVTGKSSIDYNMPEIFETKPYHNQILMSAMAGSIKFQLEIIKKFGHIRKGVKEPELDDFVLEATKHTIKEYKPNLILVHLIDTDSHKHYYGVDSEETYESLLRQDKRLGEIIKTLEEEKIIDKCNIIALGDHSAINVNYLVRMNKVFRDNNLIEFNDKGKMKSYKAIVKSLDGAAYIYLKDKSEKTKVKVKEILNEEINNNTKAIERVFLKEESISLGANNNADFIIEAKKGFYFVDDFEGEAVERVVEEKIGNKGHRHKATHGYSPNKDEYSTFFIGYGKNFKSNYEIEWGELINHCPTIAKIMGFNMESCDGKVINEILK